MPYPNPNLLHENWERQETLKDLLFDTIFLR